MEKGRLPAPLTLRPLSLRSGSDGNHVAERGKTRKRLALQLPHPFACQIELMPDRLERPRLAFESKAQLENPPLPLRERVQRLPHALATQRLLRLVERV